MASESVAHDPVLSSDEQGFLRLWRLLDPTQRARTFSEVVGSGRNDLYRSLGMGGDGDVPMDQGVAKTEVGAQVLELIESVDPDDSAHVLALLVSMRQAKQEKEDRFATAQSGADQ